MKAPSRIDASPLARWFWSVDRVALALIAAILVIGLVILTAAGPAAAQRLKIDDEFHFLLRQLLFAGPALALMIGVSLLSPLGARRAGAVVFAASFALLVAALTTPALAATEAGEYAVPHGELPGSHSSH